MFLMFLQNIFQGVPKELQRSILEGFWGPFESPLGVLFDTLEGLWLFLGASFWTKMEPEASR